ncbi:MAG: metalloregulator ArsR/SmtB family transcription factor [Clostridium sp.]|nr:metalloregulator ArsR/SmtB family transcription factor [Clostridium sp.]
MKDIYEKNAKVFKALSDQNRLKILHILSDGERCACELLKHFDFTQPTLSHHMKVLIECGLVYSRKAGTWNHYSLIEQNTDELVKFLEEIVVLKDSK